MNSNSMNIPCTLEQRISKSGNPYMCLVARIGEYEKVIFMEQSEIVLAKYMFASEKATSKLNISKSTSETN